MEIKALHRGQTWLIERGRSLAIAGVVLGGLGSAPALAQGFGQLEINQDSVITISSPADNGAFYQLLILEQLAASPACWAMKPGTDKLVDPLLLQFNFSGICNRATDSNGYSIRVGGQDLGWRYSLRVVPRGDNNYLSLVGVPVDRNMPDLPTLDIGQTVGIINDYAEIELNPGWRLTKRTYEGSTLGHYYLTTDDTLADLMQPPTPPTSPGDLTRPTPLPEAAGSEVEVETDAVEVETITPAVTPLPSTPETEVEEPTNIPETIESVPEEEEVIEFSVPDPQTPADVPVLPPQAPSPL